MAAGFCGNQQVRRLEMADGQRSDSLQNLNLGNNLPSLLPYSVPPRQVTKSSRYPREGTHKGINTGGWVVEGHHSGCDSYVLF